ncbi:apolipoprotein N-acyltransferase [Roseobacter denitrificans]|uniref:Apolipoprotein N-acyltransferase n=1 Tax=Roseobacter denitrificans (strain ATCC 33942 / OCh 114) TaxID=375451 RepID=Q161G9_ROSDO|nr:apolipoprotein N-acyltransferase [Roseobacter denitrificans]ABG33374.1 apolipoprotein N-acyltransferase, putative [Roseobacter denitrificans OCh 114]
MRFPWVAQIVLAAALGVFAAFGQAPYDQPAVLLIALAGAFHLWRIQTRPRAAAVMGLAFGCGYFALALIWIVEPFQVDAARHGWMAPFAVALLSLGLALFWAAAFWAARLLSHAAFGLVLTWTAAEMARAYVFTGFPWASPAQATINGPLSQVLALGGPHAANFVLLLCAWVVSLSGRWPVKAGQAVVLAAVLWSLHAPLQRPAAVLSDTWVRLIQPNAAQHLKWQPEMAEVFFTRQLALTAAPAQSAAQTPDLVVWPETAIPWRLETAGPALVEIGRAGNGAPVVLGALRAEGVHLRNALAVIDPAGAPEAIYDKHHLVPFGEYMPFAGLANRLGLSALVAQAGIFSSGPGPELLDFGPLGTALPLICYEAVFAHGVNAAPARPDFLLQITNDAWFGQYAGPQQHLAQARMRAIEQGLPLMRAANTGISAMIDPAGRIISSLPLGQAGFIDAPLPRPDPATPYSWFGDVPVLVFLLVALGFIRLRQTTVRWSYSD